VAVTFGPYRVCEALGIGGMATVHRAEIAVDGAIYEVALKCLDPELARDRTFVRRFIAEARLGQLLRHANIARTHEVGCIDNTHFIAFEWVPGVTALQVFDLAHDTQPAPVYITLRIITQVARALAYAHDLRDEHGHRVGLIHRDIAPSNIIIGDNGVTKLIDFGVAKSSLAHVNTVAGSVIGKLGYVAPEYLKTGKCDARADIYSLGVIAWELLTGHRLFDAETLDAAEAQRFAPLLPPSNLNPHIPPELDQIILTTLAASPGKRWRTAADLGDALDAFATAAGLTIQDGDVAAWVNHEFGAPARQKVRARTADIEHDVELDIEQTFARVRARTEPIG
jgi:serine/threonine protein kinase